MKNIHILPTDCTITNLVIIGGKLNLIRSNYYSKSYIELHNYEAKAMYITSDEEIKEGDYVTNGEYISQAINEWWTKFYIGNPELKADYWKIILTTDQDLIKEGVQAIDDDFLEWFVKNPSCEEIEVVDVRDKGVYATFLPYKIIIPKEEPKQDLDCPFDFTSRCTMGRCDCKPKEFAQEYTYGKEDVLADLIRLKSKFQHVHKYYTLSDKEIAKDNFDDIIDDIIRYLK